jgi:hypothetical protein
MTQLHFERCELTYEGSFAKPAFWLIDAPGKLCDLLVEVLQSFGCTSADLVFEENGEPVGRGVTCEVDELDARVSVYGDRIELTSENFVAETAPSATMLLGSLWSGLSMLSAVVVPKTHSFLFEADAEIRGAPYQVVLNRLARPADSLPPGTETAVVYYLPRESDRFYGESSLVLNRSVFVERGLQVNATLVYEAQAGKAAPTISAAQQRLRELIRSIGLDWTED